MDDVRTVKVKLDVDEDDKELLHDTIDEFLQAANYVIDEASEGDWVETRKYVLHEETYYDVRNQTRLHSNLVQAARDQAAAGLKSVVERWSDGESVSLPTITSRFCEYDKRSATFREDYATLSTVDGRVTVRYVLPDENRDTPQSKYLMSDKYEMTSASLHFRNGEFYLHIRTKADMDIPSDTENGTVLGVDLGVENLAVTSTGKFWSGDELAHWRREYAKRRKSLQECGTRHAHENVQAVGRKESGRFKQHIHRIANGIIEEAEEHGCSYIALENLDGIRDCFPNSQKFHNWAFRRLYEYVKYKAEAIGIHVEQVNPQYTSQRCSTCGFTHERNRDSTEFECQKCGYSNHADYNAAKNIGMKLLRNQNGGEGGAPVGVRLNTGMLNANGVTSVPDSV